MSLEHKPLTHSLIPEESNFSKASTATVSPITLSALGQSTYGTPYDPSNPAHQELQDSLKSGSLTSLPDGKHDDIPALHALHRRRRIARNIKGFEACEAGTSATSSYPQERVRHPYSLPKRVTLGEYAENDKSAVVPNAVELGDPDMSDEELIRQQAIYSISAQVLDGSISPLRKMVIMQLIKEQPFTEYNSHPDAPSTMNILGAYLLGHTETLERMVPGVNNGSVNVQLNVKPINVKPSNSMKDPEYCDKFPGTEGKITTFDSTHELFTKHGLSPDKWRFRELPIGDRSLLHVQFLDWPDGGIPVTDDDDDNDDSAQLMTLCRLLADPSSCLSRPQGMTEDEADRIDPDNYSQSRALFAHCLAGKGRAGTFMVQMLDEMSHRRTARQILDLTPHGKRLIAEYGTDEGKIFTHAMKNHLLKHNLVHATDDGEPMAVHDLHPDAVPPIHHETITDPAMQSIGTHADDISAIRLVIEHEIQMRWNVERAEERRQRYAEMVRETVRRERARLVQSKDGEESASGA